MEKIELRSMDVTMTTSDDGSMIVNGIVNVPEQRSQLLYDMNGRSFYETIAKGVFQEAIDEANEILFLADHDKKKILASTKNSSLELEEDDEGVHMKAEIVDTTYGKDTYALIKSGLVSNMSFGFIALKDKWSKTENGTPLRTVTKMALREVSSVKNPAYVQSSIDARGLETNSVIVPFEEEREVNEDLNKFEIRDINGEIEGSIEVRSIDETTSELFFYGYIGNSSWEKMFDKDCTIPQDIINLLEPLKQSNNIDIHVNSGGGSVFGGYAIYNLLKQLEGNKRVFVDGLAGSIASVIAFAGDELIIPANSMLMIHKPLCGVQGNADDLRKQADILDVIQQGILSVYMSKAKEGVDSKVINKMIDKETWLTGEEASKYFNITLTDACNPKKKKKEKRSIDDIKNIFGIVDEVKEEPKEEVREVENPVEEIKEEPKDEVNEVVEDKKDLSFLDSIKAELEEIKNKMEEE